ncbi:hypothetical protein PoB_005065200 [Plakobranchus ocellatus]|uniref:Secreted protein n=1 Tax=Plakobranchus ocellatus TaxID=259542 RepID=A0AAV4BXT9_9GAST|nr:hypothetical protein PoB_005065200 [Plakobranchus ocellatus]
MTRQRNLCIIFAAVVMATRSRRQRIMLTGLLDHPPWRLPAISWHSDKHAEPLLPIPRKVDTQWWQNNRIVLGSTGGAGASLLRKDLYCVTPVQTL